MYKVSDFAQTKDEAVQWFLHQAHDHMIASRYLSQTILIDSAGYLCNISYELLLKALHLYENGHYRGIHKLVELHEGLNKKVISKRDIPLIKIIDRCSLIRYPIDKALQCSNKKLRLGNMSYEVGELGGDDLEKADKLFFKIWRKLEKNQQFKKIIKNIQNNPYRKGNRILMEKPKNIFQK